MTSRVTRRIQRGRFCCSAAACWRRANPAPQPLSPFTTSHHLLHIYLHRGAPLQVSTFVALRFEEKSTYDTYELACLRKRHTQQARRAAAATLRHCDPAILVHPLSVAALLTLDLCPSPTIALPLPLAWGTNPRMLSPAFTTGCLPAERGSEQT